MADRREDELAPLDGFLMHLPVAERDRRGPSGTLGEKLSFVRQRLLREFTSLKTQAAKVADDAHLTRDGKKARWAELATKHDMAFLTDLRTQTQANRERLRTLLFALPKSTKDPMDVRFDAREIRDSVKGYTQQEINQVYLKAVTTGQHEIVRALTTGPLGSLVSADFQQRVETERAQASKPEMYENFEQVSLLQEELDGLHNHASGALHALGMKPMTTEKEGTHERPRAVA